MANKQQIYTIVHDGKATEYGGKEAMLAGYDKIPAPDRKKAIICKGPQVKLVARAGFDVETTPRKPRAKKPEAPSPPASEPAQ